MTEFKREIRYIVLKVSDVEKYLNKEQLIALSAIGTDINFRRRQEGRELLKAAVVESDWPEYEPVWKMIEDRVSREQAQENANSMEGAISKTALSAKRRSLATNETSFVKNAEAIND